MFRQLFSTGSGTWTLVRLGCSQVKPSICVSTHSCSRQLLSELSLRRQYCSVPAINSQLRCPSYRTVGQRIFRRGYSNDARGKRSAASYIVAVFIFMVGGAYAGVPLYRMICQVSSFVSHCLCYTYIYNTSYLVC